MLHFLGTDHHEFYCTENEAKDIIKDLPYYYDEPFGDSSAIPTTLVSKYAKKEVTVALSADGGDEIFCGYDAYSFMYNKMNKINKIPKFIKPALKSTLLFGSKLIPNSKHRLKHKAKIFSNALSDDEYDIALVIYKGMINLPDHLKVKFLPKRINELKTCLEKKEKLYHSVLEMIMAVDFKMYLQNDILTKVDRATMSVSLEGREPILDHRILEFSAQLPLNFKYDGKTTKRILKDITHEYIPKKMLDRPKAGFSLPVVKWLNEDLSYLVEEYLSREALSISGLFDEKYLDQQIKLFKTGKFHYISFVWKLLMFQMWYKRWMD